MTHDHPQLRTLIEIGRAILERLENMATLDDLNAALGSLTTAVQALPAPVNALITAITAHPAAQDFAPQVAVVQAALKTVSDETAAAAAALTPAAPAPDTAPAQPADTTQGGAGTAA